ncbi:hypothetical protein B0H65DRAFT_525856 [Neurospora tetraspora]|uniref:Tetraspanin Tsp3 n=1 Tax=Neurospora tetraspora TaxID=94610 RepID=A0AAE0JGW2_9PEZI|nr:hypothetical protein B0H65DRAFT_525856 [Neurospora tetraspora]
MITLGLIYTLIILILIAFAIYEHIHAQSLSLPISPGLTLLTILLPLLSAFNTAYLYRVSTTTSPNQQNRPKLITAHSSSTITPNPSNPHQQLQVTPHGLRPHARRPLHPSSPSPKNPTLRSLLPSLSQTLQTTQLTLSLILLTLATSSLTSAPFSSFPSSGLGSIEQCALEQTWSHFFRSHDADSIRKIQDALQCCGFRNPKHMSWPFPSGRNGQPGGGGKGTEQCGTMWPERKEGCAKAWEGEFRGAMGGEIGVVAGVMLLQIVGWGVGRWMKARAAGRARARARTGAGGRGSGMVNGEGSTAGNGNNNNSWWNKLLQSFGVPHGDEEDTYRGLEDGGAQRRPLLGAGHGEGHVGIEEVDDEDEDGDGEERDVERGGSDEESRPDGVRRGGSGYGSANSRVQPSGIHVADPWADGN